MAIMDPYGLIVFLIDNDGNVGVTFLIASLIYSDMTKVLQSLASVRLKTSKCTRNTTADCLPVNTH